MKPKKFQILHPEKWSVLRVFQFEYKRGTCQTVGTILYERPYKDGEYTSTNQDVIDETIKKGLTNLCGNLESFTYDIKIEGERDDFIRLYCEGKKNTTLTIRCMPQVEIFFRKADLEQLIVGYDFDFKIYLDYVEEGTQTVPLFTISSYEPQNQDYFNKNSQLLKER